ncbi:hypothetical protein GTP81_29635, partial [Rugamonas sp. FT107W]
QAGASGAANNAALGGQAGDSGLSNQAAEAGQAAGSGIANQAGTRLDAYGSGIHNASRELDDIDASGRTSAAKASGAVHGSGAGGMALGDVSTGHGASLAQNAADSGTVVKVAPNGLSLLNPNANGSYVFETRPQFANHGDWISSDYLLKALDTDPAVTQKRLGDGFYEQRLVRDQLIELTGRAPSGGQSDDSRYKELLTSGISVAQQYGLRPGIALSADQISHLTSDIVWMETETVSLPDGTVENVLVPKVYLAHAGADAVKASGALVTGDGVDIRTTDNLVNRGGLINGANGRTVLVAGQDIVNQGGAVKGGAMDLQAGRDVINQSLTVKQEYASVNTSGSYTTLSNQAGIAAGGALTIKAGRDVTDTGGTIAGASVDIGAGRDASFNALQTGSTYSSQVAGYTEKDSSTTYKTGQVASSGDLKLTAGQDIKLSGTQVAIGATGNGTLVAGRDVTVVAVVNEVNISKQNDPGSKLYDKEVRQDQTVVGASVTAGGNLAVKAGDSGLGNLALAGSNLAGGGKVQLTASGDVSITQVQETHLSDLAHHDESSSAFKKSSNTSADYSNVSKVVGSGVSGDSVTVHSDKDIVIRGSELTATGALTLNAGRDLLVSSAQQSDSEQHSAEHMRSGFSLDPRAIYTKSEDAKAANGTTVTQVGSVLSGGSVSASSGRDTVISGSTVVADKDIAIDAGRNLNIVSAENSSDGASSSSSKKSGSIGTTFQPAFGTVKSATDGTNASVTQVGSQIASLGGDVSLKAGEQYTQTASEVKAPKGDIDISAKDVLINAAMNSSDSSDHTSYSKTAIGGSVSVPLVDALKSANSMVNAAKNASDSRMQALAAMNAASSLKDAYKTYTAAQDPGIKVSISLGNQKSDSTVVHTSDTAVGSTVSAGGNVTITATGAGKDSNLTAIGSDIKAGQDVSLSADNQVNLLAAQNTASQHSTNSSSSSSIGIGFGIGGTSNGFTIDLAVSQARGKADGDDIGYSNSHVTAGNQVVVHSGGDTTLKGGVIAAPTVVADIGGNLNIESLQDSSKYNSKQSSAGLNASLCIPPACYGASTVGGSIGKSHVDGDFLSVLEQSGIKAGDGGFQVAVDGNTDLKGGLLSSSQTAIDQGSNVLMTGSLTSSDLQNKDHYDAGGFALSGSISGKMGDQSPPKEKTDKWTKEQKEAAAADGKPGASAGFGSASGDQGSTTASGISGGLIAITDQAKQLATGKDGATAVAGVDRDVTTESAAEKAGALTKGWDAQQLQKDVDAQIAITQEFSKQAPKAIASYATSQAKAIRDHGGSEEEAKKWDEGGAYRVALHTVSGAFSGGLSGALASGGVASTADLLTDLQAKTQVALEAQGLSVEAAKMLAQGLAEATSLSIGASLGGMAGAASALATDTNNRQQDARDKLNTKVLAEKSNGKYTMKEIENALRYAGLKDGSGKIAVAEGTIVTVVNNVNISNGQTLENTVKEDSTLAFVMGDSRTLLEKTPSQPSNDLMAFIVANTGGKASPYVFTPAKVYTDFSSLPSAPNSTHRVTQVVDGRVYAPLYTDCPAAACQTGDTLASAIPDAETKAYTDAVAKKIEKDINIFSLPTMLIGDAVSLANAVGRLSRPSGYLNSFTLTLDERPLLSGLQVPVEVPSWSVSTKGAYSPRLGTVVDTGFPTIPASDIFLRINQNYLVPGVRVEENIRETFATDLNSFLNAEKTEILAKVNSGRYPYTEINGAIGELRGYKQATNDLGHIGIQAPGKTSVPGPDYVTLDPAGDGTIYVWDAKYRGPNAVSYPKSIPDDKLTNWMSQLKDSIKSMPEGPAKEMALDALKNGRVVGKIFKWPQ